jgi:hypothetical protein
VFIAKVIEPAGRDGWKTQDGAKFLDFSGSDVLRSHQNDAPIAVWMHEDCFLTHP